MRDFNHTVNVLVQAYLNDTLEHGNCTACAVGNMIADAIGTKPKKMLEFKEGDYYRWRNGLAPKWTSVFCTPTPRSRQRINPDNFFGEAKQQIVATGYNYEELAKIEFAFERGNTLGYIQIIDSPEKSAAMFNGLMAVVDVLAEIHGIDITEKESAKALFVKA